MPSKTRITVNPTPKFMAAVKKYRVDNDLPSDAAALLELAAKGLGVDIEPRNGWGGKREIEQIMEAADALTDYGRNDPTE